MKADSGDWDYLARRLLDYYQSRARLSAFPKWATAELA